MSEIINATYKLLDTLDNSEVIQKITQYKKILEQDEEVLSLVKKINNEKNIELKIKLRKKLYSNNNYKNYMDSYNELNYIVLNINNKFKEYTNTKECISKE